MRKTLSIAICASTLLALSQTAVLAEGPQISVTGGPAGAIAAPLALPASLGQDGDARPVQVVIDDVTVKTDPAPFYRDGQVWVPVREIWELLGATVTYDTDTHTVRAVRGNLRAGLVQDSTQAFVDTTAVELPAAPTIVAGRTFASLSFVAESLGAKPSWDGQKAHVVSGLPAGTVSRNQRLPEVLQKVVDLSQSLLGVRYRWGGALPSTGFDCSGFISYVAGTFGVELPRTSFDMFRAGQPVSRSSLRPGDLVFFTTYSKGASHAGIYLGSGQFIHANSTGGRVRISDMDSGYYAQRFLGGRRVFRVS